MKRKNISNFSDNYIDDYFRQLKEALGKIDKRKVKQVIKILLKAYQNRKKVFIMGNGGSAATASHMACDLGKGTLKRIYDEKEERFKVYSLTDNVALLTAFANDVSFEDVFAQQLQNLVEKDDVVIALSGSGNSINLIKAVKYAVRSKAITIGILGFKTGGELAKIVDCAIVTDNTNYGICEDMQLILDHVITGLLAKMK